jgi:hypothetical protein
MKNCILFIIYITLCQSILAQSNDFKPVKKSEIGLHAGAVTGIGLSYRHWFGKYGLQLTGVPLKTDNTEIYSIAVTALYDFYDTRNFRVFGYLGNHYFYDWEKGDQQPWKNVSTPFNKDSYDSYSENDYYYKETYSIGFGPGFAFGKTIRFNLMMGYAFYDILGTFEMYPTGEIGVYYRF